MADAPTPVQGDAEGDVPAAEARRERPGLPRRATPRHASASAARHRLRKLRALLPLAAEVPVSSEPPPPPQELIAFLRAVGTALIRAGESVADVQDAVNRLGTHYGFTTVHTFAVPTGVFVRAGRAPDSVIDFAPSRARICASTRSTGSTGSSTSSTSTPCRPTRAPPSSPRSTR